MTTFSGFILYLYRESISKKKILLIKMILIDHLGVNLNKSLKRKRVFQILLKESQLL